MSTDITNCANHHKQLAYRLLTQNKLLCIDCVKENGYTDQQITRVELFTLSNTPIGQQIEDISDVFNKVSTHTFSQIITGLTDSMFDSLLEEKPLWSEFNQKMNKYEGEFRNLCVEYNKTLVSIENREASFKMLTEKIKSFKAKLKEEFITLNHTIKEALFKNLDIEFNKMIPNYSQSSNYSAPKKITGMSFIQEPPSKKVKVDDKEASQMLQLVESHISLNEKKHSLIFQDMSFKENMFPECNLLLSVKIRSLNIKKIVIRNNLFQSGAFSSFFELISDNKTLKAVSFRSMSVSTEMLTVLSHSLGLTDLNKISFTDCKIEISDKSKCTRLWEIIENDYLLLKRLKLKNCGICDAMCEPLQNALKKNTHMEYLSLPNNHLTAEGLQHLLSPFNIMCFHLKKIVLKGIDSKMISKFKSSFDMIEM